MKDFKMNRKKTGLVFVLILSILLVPACAGGIPTGTPANEGEKAALETMQVLATEMSYTATPVPTTIPVLPTTVSPSPIPASAVPPSPVPATATPAFSLPGAARVTFAPGATYGTTRGTIQPGQTRNFVLQAGQGQPLIASVSSQNNDVTMSIIAESGVTLLPASQGWSNWQGTLPATQDYYFQVFGGASEQTFSLSLSIPSRISFEPGATSATVSGQTVNGNITSYVVAAQGGQTMDILLSPDNGTAALTVWGFSDGQPYMRAQMGSTNFHMQLPSTQDYIIDVVPQAGEVVNYTLKVDIQ